MKRITESDSNHQNLEKMSTLELLTNINREDQTVALAVNKIIPEIEKFVDAAFERLNNGGRIFYIGAGTSGRLGILDASECPPTFGVTHDLVVGLIAGGDHAIRKAVEFAEDDREQAWKDLQEYQIDNNDVLVGIAASGTTPYVLGAIKTANKNGILTAGISCNPNSPLAELVQHSMVAEVGPEFVTGSTRMKSGTAQKLILNMISTSLMIKLGRVEGNKMVDMQLSNHKLVERGAKMIQSQLDIDFDTAKEILLKHGSVRKAVDAFRLEN
ncbi:MAG: N-acetylmuramic acid 6-phosphate etherase [Crocinitomicaceae bacterium]|nr:N-acetylmuramic acid 6-phosphate etherase [Crocinitomicaceae bacterium]